jgi:hypothetical protein
VTDPCEILRELVRDNALWPYAATSGHSPAETLRQAVPSARGGGWRLPGIFCKPEVTGSIPVRSIAARRRLPPAEMEDTLQL